MKEKKKYKTIYADPPWLEVGGGKIHRGADRHYPLMKTEDIKWLDVGSIADKDCHLYLWTTNNFLEDALEVMRHWGFRYITNIVWCKDRFGLGYYFRGQHELLLFGTKGNLKPKHKLFNNPALWSGTPQLEGTKTPTTVIHAKRTEHSSKPQEFYDLIETVSHSPYAELFARNKREGWDTWGNTVENNIELKT